VGTLYLRWCWIDGGEASTVRGHLFCCAIAAEDQEPCEPYHEVCYDAVHMPMCDMLIEEREKWVGLYPEDRAVIEVLWREANHEAQPPKEGGEE